MDGQEHAWEPWKQQDTTVKEADEGGYCDRCQPGDRDRYPHDFSRLYRHPNEQERREWPGRYCRSCIVRIQRHLPASEHFLFCEQCRAFVASDQIFHDVSIGSEGLLHVGDLNGWCFACIECAKITCVVCGRHTLDHNGGDRCWDCDIRDPGETQLSYHQARARAVNAEASLTPDEWIAAVKHFGYKCAYCGKQPFQVLEHYMPIHLGGGTCRANCLPACTRCNGTKGSRHPDELGTIFSISQLEMIRAYLAQQ